MLDQLQRQLLDPDQAPDLQRDPADQSLLFQAAPGPWREVQLIRDRLQWLAADPELEPRDVLVMTPQVDRYAPLLSSVFNDRDATGVDLPWRLTDRSQQSTPGLTMAMLDLLELAAGRLTATGLERLMANPAVQRQQSFSSEDASAITTTLQRTGFRWGWMPASGVVMKSTACSGALTDGCLGLCCPNVMVWLPEVRLLFSRCWIHSASCVGGVCWIGSRAGSRVCVSPGPHRPGWSC